MHSDKKKQYFYIQLRVQDVQYVDHMHVRKGSILHNEFLINTLGYIAL